MSLRLRIVLIVTTTLVVSLGGAVGAVFGAVQDWIGDRDNDALATVSRQVQDLIESGAELDTTASPDTAGQAWQSMAERGEIPSYFGLYNTDGLLEETAEYGDAPPMEKSLPDRLWPTDTAETFHHEQGWLLRSAHLQDGRVLVSAMRTDISDELIQRTRNVTVTCAVAGLLLAACACAWAVRRQLRPLEDIAATADTIGAGDLGQRIRPVNPRSEVGRLSAALNAMLEQVQNSFEAQSRSEVRLRRFLADASHELRTPIAAIRGYAELFNRGASKRPEDLEKVIGRIEDSAIRVGALVEEMLLLARLDEGRPLETEPVDLAVLAIDAVADAHALDPDREFTLDTAQDVIVAGDTMRLRQVVTNLLSNVSRHTPADASATVRIAALADEAIIEVRDNGPGMSAEETEHVFDRFYRADTARARTDGGTGLGLSIVTAIVTAHGGTVAVTSSPGAGTTFTVRLPRHRGEHMQ